MHSIANLFPSRFLVRLCIAAALLAGFTVPPALATDADFDGSWQGTVAVPGSPLGVEVELTSAGGELAGTITIPAQGLKDLPLEILGVGETTLRFAIAGIPGAPTFDGTLSEDGATLAGPFTQGGGQLTFTLLRGEVAALERAASAAQALEGLDAQLEQALEDFQLPGLALAIVKDGEVIYAEGFGFRDIEEDLPMTADSLFAIGSTTKAMTATVLGMQVDEGLLHWDQRLVELLPAFRLEDPAVTARISPRDLLCHRSGLPRHDFLWYNNNDLSRAEFIQRFPHLELTADLRERFQYNNLMFMTAGYLSGQLDGGSWEEVMRRRLFEPMGMERTNLSVLDSQQDADHAVPYRETDEGELERIPFRRIDAVGPAGSVNSSVREMARWLLFNLEEGTVGDRSLIQASTLADIHSPHMTQGETGDEYVQQSTYGLGWGVEVYRGHRRLRHGGGIDGFVTTVQLFPDEELGLVAFDNRGSGLANAVAQTAADRLLGLEPVNWIGRALEQRETQRELQGDAEAALAEATRVPDTRPSHELGSYVGIYHHPGYGNLEVTHDAEAQGLTWIYNDIATPLQHWHYNVFSAAENPPEPTFALTKVQFRTHLDGSISEVIVPFDLAAAPIVFSKQADPRLLDAAYLQRFAGVYVGTDGPPVTLAVSGTQLTLSVPGQPLYTLVPEPSGRFAIEGLQGFQVTFADPDADGRPATLRSIQPNGVFDSTRVEE